MYEQTLTQAGLTKDQAEIYEILIKNGPLKAGKISQKSTLKRGLVYKLLDQMAEIGLIDKIEKPGKAAVFTAAHPLKLKELAEKQEQQAKDSQLVLSGILPSIISDYNLVSGQPNVRFYEGKEGIIKIYEELLAEKKPIDSIEDKGEMAKFIPEYFPTFIKKRMTSNIYNRVVCPAGNPINKTDEAELRQTRNISVEKFPLSMDIKIVGDKVSLITFKKDTAIGIIIDHQEIADNFRILFEYMWETSKTQAASGSLYSAIANV
ncbi:MAG: helix-turn-helix domain-containing protein [Patescibacteria group bacterium]|jgi:sugar-specific transcriptional regulator TrmB